MLREPLAIVRRVGRHRRRKLIEAVVRNLPHRTADEVAAAMYAHNLVPTVDLLAFSSPAPLPEFDLHVLYGPTTDVIPAESPTLPEVGRGSPGINAYRLTDVDIDIDSGLVFTSEGVIEQSGSARMESAADLAAVTGATRRFRNAARHHVPGPVAPLGDASLTYYHLLLDVAARASQLATVDPRIELLTSNDLAPITKTLLDRSGLRYDVVPPGTVVHADEVWFCDRSKIHNWPRHGDIDALRRLLLPPEVVDSSEPTVKVYVSRSNVGRALVDESLLEDYLADRGFVVAHLEDMTIDEQVELMASAKVVIGPHGAGLANVIFMQPGGRLIELGSRAYGNPAFRRLGALSDLDYDLLLLPEVGDSARADDAIAALERSGLLAR